MHENETRPENAYPTGRGYGNDYMRGGEIFGGYGYSSRPEYERRRGDTAENDLRELESATSADEGNPLNEPPAKRSP